MVKLERPDKGVKTLSPKPSAMVKQAVKGIKSARSPVMAPHIDKDMDRKYMAEDALRTLMRAREHEANTGLMKDVKQVASSKIQNMKDVIK